MEKVLETIVTDSTCIAGFSYNPETQVLKVQFTHGAEYTYEDIERRTYDEWKAAESKGKYYNQKIRGKEWRRK